MPAHATITVEIGLGASVKEAFLCAINTARYLGLHVRFYFNDVECLVGPMSNAEAGAEQYRRVINLPKPADRVVFYP